MAKKKLPKKTQEEREKEFFFPGDDKTPAVVIKAPSLEKAMEKYNKK